MHLHWHEGLFLQPHHLQLMQRQFVTGVRAARELLTPFCFGVIKSQIAHDDLAAGRIRFERLQVIMPSGQEVFFPEAANLPSLDIKSDLVRGAGPLEVLLVVPLWTKNRANAFRQGERPDPRTKLLYIPEEVREVNDENTGDNPQSLQIRKVNARFAIKGQEDFSDMETLPLLRVVRATGEESGKGREDPEFVPPSLLLRSSRVLHDQMRELVAQLNASREQYRVKASTAGLGLEVKWELTMRLLILNRFCGSLSTLVGNGDRPEEEGILTPFALYLQLRELLGELLALHPVEKLYECEPYNHLDPLRSFKELDRKIRQEIRVAPGREPLKVPFAGSPGLLRAKLEPQHFEKPLGYYLGVKSRLDRTKLSLFLTDSNKFKVMPASMEQVAIFGIELKEENYPPLELPGQSDLYYFRLLHSSNQRRWDQIQQDKGISLVWNNTEFSLSDSLFTLYMTLPSSAT